MAERHEALPPLGSVIAGKYRLETELGRGGMGAVFRASHVVTGRGVAIKCLLPTFSSDQEAVGRFIREAKLASAVDHENVVEIYDVGHEESGFYLVMELLRGRSLGDRIAEGPLSPAEFLPILKGVCAGLEAAHRAGVVHRDLKPENIFLAEARNDTGDVIPKIVDFGVSKGVAANESSIRMTSAGVAMGTPYYMSPEQFRSAGDVDHRTDIYSLGVVAYEALSGVVPHDGETASAIVIKVATEEPVPLVDRVPVEQPLARAVHRALSKDPAMRQSSAMQFYDEVSSGSLADIRLPLAATEHAMPSTPPPTRMASMSAYTGPGGTTGGLTAGGTTTGGLTTGGYPSGAVMPSEPPTLPVQGRRLLIALFVFFVLAVVAAVVAVLRPAEPAPSAEPAPPDPSDPVGTPTAPPPAPAPPSADAVGPMEAAPVSPSPEPAPTVASPSDEAARPRPGRRRMPAPAATPTPAMQTAAVMTAPPTMTTSSPAAMTQTPSMDAVAAAMQPAPQPTMMAPTMDAPLSPMGSEMVGRLGVEVTNEGF